MDLNPGGRNVENTLCQKVSCIKVAWTAHQGIFTSFKGKSFKVKVFNVLLEVAPLEEAVEVLEGRAPLNWSCVMDVLVCQQLLQEGGQCQGKKCQWDTVFAVYCLLFISPGLLPSAGTCPGTGGRALWHSIQECKIPECQEVWLEGGGLGLMLRRKSPGGGNQIPSPWAAWLHITFCLSDGF